MTQTIGRSIHIPKHYTGDDLASAQFNKTYLGFVKNNSDAISMGRLQVWIPELSTNSNTGIFTVNYCSPFAGSTPLDAVKTDDKASAQMSYGFFAVPPDIDNEVVVNFINGDPNRGIWIGCLFQQYMNNMVPGIPSHPTTLSQGKENAPTMEYNKKDGTEAPKDTPLRPPYVPLTTGLLNEGLFGDDVRGPSTSSARRGGKPNVLGLLSPGGSQFVMDDAEDNKFIRLRTAGGTQVLINDTIGMIYMISKNGNSWIEISDKGIDMYSAGSISVRSQADLNFHADGSVNIFGSKGVNVATPAGMVIQATGALNITSGGVLNATSLSSMSLSSKEDVTIGSSCTVGLKAGCNIALQADGCLGLTSTCDMYFKGQSIFTNGPTGPLPGTATESSITPIKSLSDTELDIKKGYPELATKTIVSELPSHEPWQGHSAVSTPASTKAVNLNNSTRVASGDASAQPSPTDILPGQNEPTTIGDNTNWWIPASGIITSLFGPRSTDNHPGIDIGGNGGNSIIASKAGKVVYAGVGRPGTGYNDYGNCVGIDHGNGIVSLYGHMIRLPVVNKGDTVTQGQLLGNVGNSGKVYGATGIHLHFEIRKGSAKIDPATLIAALGRKGSKVNAGDPNPNKNPASTPSS